MNEFDFLEPATPAEASRMAADLGESCRFIAGGTALMLAMRQRMLSPSHLVSLQRLEALRGIQFDPQSGLRIGALTLHSELAQSPEVLAHYPVLASMAGRVANPQVRNQGTLGGNLCYADPATDPPTCLLALDASVELVSHRGTRVLALSEFLVDYYTTAIEEDELVQAILIPPPDGSIGAYTRFLRTAAEHRPLVSVAVLARRQGPVCLDLRIVTGGSTTVPTRLRKAEYLLAGKTMTADVIHDAVAQAVAEIEPLSDLRGSADYRRDMMGIVARRTVASLFGLSEE